MDIPTHALAYITISYNEKGQFVFDVTGENEAVKELARIMIISARAKLNTTAIYANKLVLAEEPENWN